MTVICHSDQGRTSGPLRNTEYRLHTSGEASIQTGSTARWGLFLRLSSDQSRQKSLNQFGPRRSDLAASSSPRRPASVILIRPTAIALPVSLCAASPARTSLASIGRVKPWTCMIASVAPNGLQACSALFAAETTFSRPHGDCVRHRSIAEKPRRFGRGKSGEVEVMKCPVGTFPTYPSHSQAAVA